MATALANLGYIADRFSPAENRPLFRALVATALKSHLPVILLVMLERETGAGTVTVGHAVTVTGYSEPDALVHVPTMFADVPPLAIRSGSLSVVYVHDDNLGSHAHYELRDGDDEDEGGNKKLKLLRGRSSGEEVDWWKPDEGDVVAALVPKPVKLRLPLPDLLLSLLDIRRLLTDQFFPGLELHFDAAFSSGVELQRSVIDHGYDPKHVAGFQLSARLPRHLGLLRVLHGETVLCEVVIDVTEVERQPRQPSVLAILGRGVPADTVPGLHIAQTCQRFKWPVLLAPAAGPLPASHPLSGVLFPPAVKP